jgi:hypothetical protein
MSCIGAQTHCRIDARCFGNEKELMYGINDIKLNGEIMNENHGSEILKKLTYGHEAARHAALKKVARALWT